MIKLLITDDSPFIRAVLTKILSKERDISIVGYGKNGKECIELTERFKPDVIILDIEMPVMSGMDALKIIKKKYNTPIIILSSLSHTNQDITFECLKEGAIDFIPKPGPENSLDIFSIKDELVFKIKAAYRIKFDNEYKRNKNIISKVIDRKNFVEHIHKNNQKVIIGISTGGPALLNIIIPKLKFNDKTCIIIVQHMPPIFTRKFADRLDTLSPFHIKEAEHYEEVLNGTIYIAPGGKQLSFKNISFLKQRFTVSESMSKQIYRPSIDTTMHSASQVYGKSLIGIIMTGMGGDGTLGAYEIHRNGGKIIIQAPDTCVIDGMPNSVMKKFQPDLIATPDEIVDIINNIGKSDNNNKSDSK